MLTITQFAKKHDVTRSWVHSLLLQRRIPGAKRQSFPGCRGGGIWMIPPDAKILPLDKRKG